MITQKKVRNEVKEQAPVIIDGIILKHVDMGKGRVATFVEIKGKDLAEQIDFGNRKDGEKLVPVVIETGEDEMGYPLKYQIRFAGSCNINTAQLCEGVYKLISNNLWIDFREDYIEKRILRVAQVDKFECYFEFTKEEK